MKPEWVHRSPLLVLLCSFHYCIAPTGPRKIGERKVQSRVCSCSTHLAVSSQEKSRAAVLLCDAFLSLELYFNQCISKMFTWAQGETGQVNQIEVC